MNKLNHLSINFDVHQRFSGIENILNIIDPLKESTILDVGGYPASLADFLSPRRVIVVDHPYLRLKNYIQASGDALPFKDNSFNIVISSDTLEHIPENNRKVFLEELLRVASKHLIIGSPFYSEEVLFCEELIYNIHLIVEREPHPWLAEHINYGLPSLKNTEDFFKDKTCDISIFHNGNLEFWFILEAIENLARGVPEAKDIFSESMKMINTFWNAGRDSPPSYRKIILIAKNGEILQKIKESNYQLNQAVNKNTNIFERIKPLADIFINIARKIGEQKEMIKSSENLLSKEVLKRMTETYTAQSKMLIEKENEIQNLKNKIKNIENSFIFKIASRFRRGQ